jgi:sugar/nucleoside kinase (ribokinase family)
MVFCNEVEACALAQEESVEEAYRALRSRHGNVAITRGDRGSLVQWFGREAAIPAYAVQTVDTTGAGDMYAGAFLYGVLHGHHPEQAGRLASYCSAQVVAQYGARLKANHIEVRDSILHTSPRIA